MRESVLAADGIAGSVRDLYFDDRSWALRYLVVATGGWLRGGRVLIAPQAVDVQGSGEGVLRLQLTQEAVRHAPAAATAPPVFRQIEIAHAVQLGYPYYWSDFELWGAVGGGSRADAEQAARAGLARSDPHLRSAAALIGCRVSARDGTLGALADFLVDERTWHLSALVVDTRRWWPGGELRVAPERVEHIDWAGRRLQLRATRSQASNARGARLASTPGTAQGEIP